MELADLVLVNKADGDQANLASQTVSDYRAALHFMQARTPSWTPQVEACSALNNTNIETAWSVVTEFRQALVASGELTTLRAQQARAWMWAETAEMLIAGLKNHPTIKSMVPELEQQVLAGTLPAIVAAERLIGHYKASE